MKLKLFSIIITIIGLTLLAGCGGGGTGGTAGGIGSEKNALAESQGCIDCHDATSNGDHNGQATVLTPGTQKPVVTEWKASTHNTGNGASCRDCHGSGYLHSSSPKSCQGCHGGGSISVDPIKDPDASDQCAKCHAKVNPRHGQNDGYGKLTANGVPAGSTTRFTHFSTGKRINYVSSNYRQNCRKCHNPHDNTMGKEQRVQWAESGHGNSRGLARTQLDAKTRGSRIPLDQNIGNGNYCVRCHTSTGFINFVAGNAFTYIEALPDIGDGFKSNYPDYGFKTGDQNPYVMTGGVLGAIRPYVDKSREGTNCDVCHLDNRINSTGSSSYSGSIRPVALASGVLIHYPYSSSGTGHFKTITPVQFDTLGNSNLCLTCHSGRATGETIRTPLLDYTRRPAAPSIHDFAGGAVLQGEKSGFLFYTSPLKYKTMPAHRTINIDGNGPCISCHMPKLQSSKPGGGLIHAHYFRPVTWKNDDNNDDIIDIISNPGVCSSCHTGATGSLKAPVTPASMNDLRKGFRLSLLILAALRPSTNNWTGTNSNGGLSITYGNLPVPALGGLPAGAYTMGATYNYGFFFNEPSAYNHSPILVRQLIYDSIDWLKNGTTSATPFGTSPASVFTAINNVPIPVAGLKWTKVDPIQGAIRGTAPNKDYSLFFATDRDLAFKFLCKDYVSGSGICNRW